MALESKEEALRFKHRKYRTNRIVCPTCNGRIRKSDFEKHKLVCKDLAFLR